MSKGKSESKQQRPANKPNQYRPNFWGMLRDVLITSINKGQFLVALISLIVICLIFKMPPEDVSKLMFDIVHGLRTYHVWGWVLFIVTITGAYITNRMLRKLHSSEMYRIGNEKSALQQKSIPKRLTSSDKQ